jgi:hypothetical protein
MLTNDFNSYYFFTSYNTAPFYAQPIIADYGGVKGRQTGMRVRVLGTVTYLHSVTFYDSLGRVIQTRGANISPGGYDVVTTQYDFSGKPLRVLHRQEKGGWSKDRWATSERLVFGKGKLWQHNLTLTAPRESGRADDVRQRPRLPAGTYLIRIYIDGSQRLKKEYPAELDQREFVADVRVDSKWPEGYQAMTVISFPQK